MKTSNNGTVYHILSLLILYHFLILHSCIISDEESILHIPSSDTLRGTRLENSIDSRIACVVYYSREGLIVFAINNANVIQLRDFTDASILYSDISMGKGKNELMGFMVAGCDPATGTLYLASTSSKSLIKYQCTPTSIKKLDQINYEKNYPNFTSVALFDTNYLCINKIFDDNKISILDFEGKLIDELPYRVFDYALNYNAFYITPTIATYHKRNAILLGDADYSHLTLLNFDNDKLSLAWEKFIIQPDVTFKNGKLYVNKGHYSGIEWVAMSESRIYVLHDLRLYTERGKPHHTFLLEYDYDGNFIRKFYLDHKIYTMDISPDGKTLYGVTEHPDIYIVKYTIL